MFHFLRGRHSLVTPIDWKQVMKALKGDVNGGCRHSLVTPIDWKRNAPRLRLAAVQNRSPFFGDAY